ncbi:hypothetical protein SOVF_018130 [Spinacia oleracea]|nr:hypothetical protein SOVF_018130 [Spinacia oleracea]
MIRAMTLLELAFVPDQILYDAFYGRYENGTGAIILLIVIWGSIFFAGLSITKLLKCSQSCIRII